jgi:hypothetical protein
VSGGNITEAWVSIGGLLGNVQADSQPGMSQGPCGERIRERWATPGAIREFAKIDRVAGIIRPYFEALL